MKLNLGCGYRKIDGYVNIDNREELAPDMLADISTGLPLKNNVAEEIRTFDFLEHISADDIIFVIEEIWRVLKPNGKFISFTPSTDGRGAFQDPTHRSFWNINSWIYYCDDEYRKLIGTKAKFTGRVDDIIMHQKLKIIHTRGNLYAVK